MLYPERPSIALETPAKNSMFFAKKWMENAITIHNAIKTSKLRYLEARSVVAAINT